MLFPLYMYRICIMMYICTIYGYLYEYNINFNLTFSNKESKVLNEFYITQHSFHNGKFSPTARIYTEMQFPLNKKKNSVTFLQVPCTHV